MAYALSLLEKSPLAEGENATQALARTLTLAKKAEQWGYRRFWVAEHHNTAGVAFSSPEILIAHLLAHTKHIRIGSGGVMLQHYSAYKVAENFNLLATLAPGRVDLGVGKAPGGLPLATHALQGHFQADLRPDFASQIIQLNAYLTDQAEQILDTAGLHAYPLPDIAPQPFLLGASLESAQLAVSQGWQFVFAAHLNSDPEETARALDYYRQHNGGKSALVGIAAIAAETSAKAAALVNDLQQFRVHVKGGQSVTVGSEQQAAEYVRQAGVSDYRIEPRQAKVLHGTAQQVHEQLEDYQQRYGVEEFIIDTPVNQPEARLASIGLLAPKVSVAA